MLNTLEESRTKIKTILQKMNTELSFEDFSDKLERETHGKFTFTQLKELLDKFYSKSSKMDKNNLLKQINLDIKTGMISLLRFFEIISDFMDSPIITPLLAFYKIAYAIEIKKKISTLEFIYKLNLILDSELTINDFYDKLKIQLDLDDMTLIIVFKGLDYNKKGKIRIEDFVLVIDSYREDLLIENEEDNLTKYLIEMKTLIEKKYLSIPEIYNKLDLNNLNYAEYGQMYKILKEELIEKEMTFPIDDIIKNVLNLIKKEGNKIFQEDFENILENVESKFNPKNDDNLAKINLNEIQLYWLNKYIILIEGINVTDKMMYDVAKDNKTGIIHLENLKKKLKLMMPIGRITAMDLNTMIDAIDINKKKYLTEKEYEEIMKVIKINNNNENQEKTKINNNSKKSMMNTWTRGNKSVNYHLLPVKGNYKVIAGIEIQKIESTNKKIKNNNLIIEDELEPTEAALPGTKLYTNEMNPYTPNKEDSDENIIIETLEEFQINDPQGLVPTYNLFNYLQLRLQDEIISRSQLSEIIIKIDLNRDGFITHNDIINYLLHNHKHRSTKLSFKRIANKIYIESKLTPNEFFTQNGLDLESELSITNLCEILQNLFEFENPISKRIYEEMKIIYSTQKRKLTLNELIDLVEEFKIEINNKKDIQNNPTTFNLKQFEENVKSFVMNLIEDNLINVDLSKNKQNLNKFRENMKCMVNLENQMNLQQFKESFIKPLRMDINLGIAIFQLLKNFTHKNEQIITKEDLITFLESYLEYNSIEDDLNNIINSLENSGSPLKYAFENIPYNPKGFITCVNFISHMEIFYPSFNKQIFVKLLRELDESRHGIIYYENLQNFLSEYSKKDKFSLNLEIKKMASEINKKINATSFTLEYFSQLTFPINNFNSIKKNEHMIITDKLCSNKILREEIFNFLCKKSQNQNGYDISVLCELIDYYRNVDYVEIINNNNINESNEKEELNIILEQINSILNSNKNLYFDSFLENLKLGESGEISSIEIVKILNEKLNLEKNKVSILVKDLDKNKSGFVSYEDLHNKLKDYFKDKYLGNLELNAKSLFLNQIKKNVNNDQEIKSFILNKLSKTSSLDQSISKDNFSQIFLDCFQNDILLFNQFVIKYSEKGKNKGMIIIRRFYDYIKDNNSEFIIKEKESQNDEELDNIIFHLFNTIEENKIPMKIFFDFLNCNSITNEGNYKLGEIRRLFKEKLNTTEEETENVIRMFSNLDEFDLLKLADYILINCEKSFSDMNSITIKMKNSIEKYKINNYEIFLKKFSLKKDIEINLKEILIGLPPIFKLSQFECFILFLNCQNEIKNNYDNKIKITIDFIFNNFKLKEIFKNIEVDDKKINKSNHIDSQLKLSLTKLSNYLEIEKDKAKLFKMFDSNRNGVLSTQEFLNSLNSCKDLNLNDSQKILLLKVADKNRDGKINYNEFLEFLIFIKDDKNEKNHKIITNNNNKGFVPKIEIDFKKLKINYEMNLRKINPTTSNKFTNYLFILQEDFYNNFNKFENIEQDFNSVDIKGNNNNFSFCVEKDKFLLVIKKRLLKIDNEISELLINFAHEGVNVKDKDKYKVELIVNYKSFLLNLVNFRVNPNVNKNLVKAPPGAPPKKIIIDEDDEEGNMEKPQIKKVIAKKKIIPQEVQDYDNIFSDENIQDEPIVTKKVNNNTQAKRPKTTNNKINNNIRNNKNVQQDYEENIFETEENETQIKSRPKSVIKVNKVNQKSNIKSNTKITQQNNKNKQIQSYQNDDNNIDDEGEEEEIIEEKPKVFINKRTSKTIPIQNNKNNIRKVPDEDEEIKEMEDSMNEDDEDLEYNNKIKKSQPNKNNISKINNNVNKNSTQNNKTKSNIKNNTNNTNKKHVQFKQNLEEYNEEEEEPELVIKPKPKTNQPKIIQSKPAIIKPIKRNITYLRTEEDEEDKAKLGKVFLGNIGLNIDLDNEKQVERAKLVMKDLFSCKTDNNLEDPLKDTGNVGKMNEDDQKHFKDFISKINNLDYKGYEYTIIPEEDYFKGADGKLIETILNSEDAAIKKCEEMWNNLKEGEKYFDKDFGSQPNDKGIKNKFSLYLNGTQPKGGTDANLIEWYRLGEISKESFPVFVDDGVESNDVIQGAIGDCWFISALSVLATKDHLLRGEFNEAIVQDGTVDDEENVMLSTGVYPPIFHGFRMKSIFCMRFFKNFKWRYVIIDDRLPCKKIFSTQQTPKLIYGKCRLDSEFWVPLIEKAYAKLHGSYESLISGFIDDGLVDLTSFVSKKYIITAEDKNNKEKSNQLWELIKSNASNTFSSEEKIKDRLGKDLKAKFFTRNNTMMGCSIDAKVVESEVIYQNRKSGVLAGHAYAILDAFEIPKPLGQKRKFSRLLRIRNPWGFKEWQGKWCDESEEISKNKDKVQTVLSDKYLGSNEKIILDREDGTFIMCFKDFRNLFNKLFICYDFPPSIVGIRYFDQWTKEESGGLPVNNTDNELKAFGKNPQYYLKLEKDSRIYISLMQKDGRMTKSKFPYPEVTKKACIIITKCLGKQKMEKFDNDLMIEISPVRQHREISIQRDLPKGEYLIIPAILKEGDVGDFCLELHFPDVLNQSKISTGQIYNNLNQKLTYTKIEKLGIRKSQCELILEDRADEIKSVKEMKRTFIYSQFQNMLKDIDNVNYNTNKGNKGNNNDNINNRKKGKVVEKQEEDEDWDEY